MSNFRKESQRYTKEAAVTPYQRAEQVWDDRIGSAVAHAKNWRLSCILSIVVNGLLALLAVLLLTNNKTMVYVAEVGDTGQVTSVVPLEKQYQPKDAENQAAITHFIRSTMELSLDPEVVKKNWNTAYFYVAGQATQLLNQLAQQSLSTARIGKVTRTVQIHRVLQITPQSYSAQWVQQTWDRNGKIIQTQPYSGIFTLAVQEPKTEEQILENPLGIKIVYYTLQEN